MCRLGANRSEAKQNDTKGRRLCWQACGGHFKHSPPFASRMTSIGQRSEIGWRGAALEQQGQPRSESSDVFSEFRESSLLEEFKNTAMARELGIALRPLFV